MTDEKPYVSSIIKIYHDSEFVRRDAKTLNEIFARQGVSLLIDVIAENIGNTAIQFNLGSEGTKRIRDSIVKELIEAIEERT